MNNNINIRKKNNIKQLKQVFIISYFLYILINCVQYKIHKDYFVKTIK